VIGIGNVFYLFATNTTGFIGCLLQLLHLSMNRIDILQYVLDRSKGKPLIFVYRTKRASIPGTIPGDTNKQTVGFTGGAYGTLLESLIRLIFVFSLDHFFVPLL
jgi:hypothetical protein